MASVTRKAQGGRQGFRVRFYVDGKLRELYIPEVTKKAERQANIVAQHCEELSKAKANNVAAAADAVAWANGTSGAIRERLVEWGLADPLSEKLNCDEGRLLAPFLDAYIASRSDVKRTTKINYKQTRRLLVEYFGASKVIKSITAADAERWRRWMLARPMAIATVSKHCKRAKTMLGEAVKDRLLTSSPFGVLKGGKESNEHRHFLVTADVSKAILDACPDADWRVIFSLARWGGLRCPSEVLALKWSDVDWDKGRFRIDSPKTGVRYCPLFPEIRAALEDAFDPELVYCVNRYRSGEQNLRTQFGRILKVAGVEPWPKLFVNLRSTRRTELQERFPDHVVNRWMGHSGKVAEKHYLQVTEEHWGEATRFGSHAGSHITKYSEPIKKDRGVKKPSNLLGLDGLGGAVIAYPMTPTGLEHAHNSQGKLIDSNMVPMPVPTSGPITCDLAEFLRLWNEMDESARRDLLAVARGLAQR